MTKTSNGEPKRKFSNRYQTEVFKTAYQFLMFLLRGSWRWPRKVRLSVERRLIDLSFELLLCLKRAQYVPQLRMSSLQQALEISWALEWSVRALWDLGLWGIEDYERALEIVISLQKQIRAWQKLFLNSPKREIK